MAGTVSNPAQPANTAPPNSPQSGDRRTSTLLMFCAFIVIVACVQIVVTDLLMPGSADSSARRRAEQNSAAAGQRDSDHESSAEQFAEVAMGDFSVSNTAAMRNVITHVNFKLTALTSSSQASSLESQIKWNEERFREAVNRTVRNANIDELYDPTLETIKRLILEETNRIFGRKVVVEILMNDIRVIQQ